MIPRIVFERIVGREEVAGSELEGVGSFEICRWGVGPVGRDFLILGYGLKLLEDGYRLRAEVEVF